jgi:hypothetical protein
MSKSLSSQLRVVVLGYIVRGPLGGLAWHHLQYVMGLARLGHDVYFVEDSDDFPGCYDPERGVTDTDPTYGLAFARNAFERVGLGGRWAYFDAHRSVWHGPAADRILEVCKGADLLLNLSGVNPLRPWLTHFPARALVDTDPAFTQIRHLTDPAARILAGEHTVFFSFGENIGRSDCAIPDDGFPWQPTRQPIVLDAWLPAPGHERGCFTTVMQWDSYTVREYAGRRYGMKSASFWPYLDLPARTGASFELALGSPTAPRDLLMAQGWRVLDPFEPTRDPWTYQRYLSASKAEFSVAKEGYVVSRSGWFSERSAAYLASGRPALVQDTGAEAIPAGAGHLTFSSPEQALVGIEEINARYAFHCQAAREIAEACFDSDLVLSSLIERAVAAGAQTKEASCESL